MDESNNKEMIEKITSSKYFGTLVEEQIRIRIGELLKRNKWIIRALVIVIGIISFILGYQFYDINSQFVKYQELFDKIQEKGNAIDSLRKKFETQLTQINVQGELISERERYAKENIFERKDMINEYRESLQDKLEDVNSIYTEIKTQVKDNKELKDSMEYYTEESKKLNIKLTKSYQNDILPDIRTLKDRTELIEKTSSIRYLFAERSERTPGGSQYRPAFIKLPFSNDILKVVFHEVLSTENPKEIMVDFYLNKNNKAFSQSVFTESDGSYEQKPLEITSSENNIYQAIPVFIYLPPNVPLIDRIPDVLILRISLYKKNESN